MNSLKPGNEVKPPAHRLVPPQYRPPDSIEHLVSDGESWQSLASRYRIPALEIIAANFKTTTPTEVNWYLREYVNCQLPTPDRYNWRFSTAARHGGIPGRAGRVYITPNWPEIEVALRKLTRHWVQRWFANCSLKAGFVEGSLLTIPSAHVRCEISIATPFATDLEQAGAPSALARGWGKHLQKGLELFTLGLSAAEPEAFPAFTHWPAGGNVPPQPALAWPLLASSNEGIAAAGWFQPHFILPGPPIEAFSGLVRRYQHWFLPAFRKFRESVVAERVIGCGVAPPGGGRVLGAAFAHPGFLKVPEFHA